MKISNESAFEENPLYPYMNEGLFIEIKKLVKKEVSIRALIPRMYEDVSIGRDSSIVKLKLKADETKDGKEHEISNILYFDAHFSG